MAARDTTRGGGPRRLLAETKQAFKTTELWLALLAIVAILIAGASIDADGENGLPDVFNADRVWLYVTIIVAAYLISRGLAKSGTPASESQGTGDGGGDGAPVTERLKAAAHAFQEGPDSHGQGHAGAGTPGDHQGVR